MDDSVKSDERFNFVAVACAKEMFQAVFLALRFFPLRVCERASVGQK